MHKGTCDTFGHRTASVASLMQAFDHRHQKPRCDVLHDELHDEMLVTCLFLLSLPSEPVNGSP